MGSDSLTNDHQKDCSEPSECKIPKTDVDVKKQNENEPEAKEPDSTAEVIDVKVVYNKNKYDVSAPSNTTIADFKKQLQELLGKHLLEGT